MWPAARHAQPLRIDNGLLSNSGCFSLLNSSCPSWRAILPLPYARISSVSIRTSSYAVTIGSFYIVEYTVRHKHSTAMPIAKASHHGGIHQPAPGQSSVSSTSSTRSGPAPTGSRSASCCSADPCAPPT